MSGKQDEVDMGKAGAAGLVLFSLIGMTVGVGLGLVDGNSVSQIVGRGLLGAGLGATLVIFLLSLPVKKKES